MKPRNAIARDLRTPKYRKRIIPNAKRKVAKRKCREKLPRMSLGSVRYGSTMLIR